MRLQARYLTSKGKKKARLKLSDALFTFWCDPSRTQLEHRILSVSTLEFTHTIAFPQNNKLKRLSTELAFR
jgi:hypothetical protein